MDQQALEARFKQLEDALTASNARLQATESRAIAAETALATLQAQAVPVPGMADGPSTSAPAAAPPVVVPPRVIGAIIDTKLMQKPRPFSGSDTEWATWSFKWHAYVGALDQRMLTALENAQTAHEPNLMNAVLDR